MDVGSTHMMSIWCRFDVTWCFLGFTPNNKLWWIWYASSAITRVIWCRRCTHVFFIRNLAPETSTQFLMKMAFFEYSVSSRFLIRAQFAWFSCKNTKFLRKIAWQFQYALGTWVLRTRFLNSEKNWVLVSYKAVSYIKKHVYICYVKRINRSMVMDDN